MKKLMRPAQNFISTMTIWDLAGLKFCLCAMGVILGIFVPKERKRPVLLMAILVFFATYIPLMTKFFSSILDSFQNRSIAPSYEENLEIDWDD